MKNIICFALLLICSYKVAGQNSAPLVNNIHVVNDAPNHTLTITYDVNDSESDSIHIELQQSTNGAKFKSTSTDNPTGDIGFPVFTGNNKTISWVYADGTDLSNIKIKVIAYDRHSPSIADMVAKVNPDSLRANLEAIVGVRHPVENPQKLLEVENYITARMNQAGVTVRHHAFLHNNTFYNNLIGHQEGLNNDNLCLINGHFDTVDDAPGADDNGTGTVGVLEAMRVLKGYYFENNIQYTNFNLEEAGLIGSNKYVNSGIQIGENIVGLINLEMIGYYSDEPNSQTIPNGFEFLFPSQVAQIINDQNRGNFVINCGNAASASLNATFNQSVSTYVPQLKLISLVVPGTGTIAPDLRRSDHAPFWDKGYKAIMITDGADTRNHNYHTPNDVISTINFEFLSNIAKASIATLATIAKPINATSQTVDLATVLSSKDIIQPLFEFTIFPNPVKNELNVEVKGLTASLDLQLSVLDVKGKVMLEKNQLFGTGDKQITMCVDSLSNGLYMLRITGGSFIKTSGFFISR